MGMFLGNEIVQTRMWIDPKAEQDKSKLDYKITFPITVFDAVRDKMGDDGGQTLREVLNYIQAELGKRQMIIPAKPSNFLATYAGAPGELGSIGISDDIPWDTSKQRNDRIPTERAVGQLLLKLGYLDASGNPTEPGQKVMWDDIIGKPHAYSELGDHDDGFVDQRTITKAIQQIQASINSTESAIKDDISDLDSRIKEHIDNIDNPHQLTPEKIGAVSLDSYREHIAAENPHNISAYTLNLGNVDNTSDEDKPISKATQIALDELQRLINALDGNVSGINVNNVYSVNFDPETSKLTVAFDNGDTLSTFIPINDLVSSIKLDKINRKLVISKLSGKTEENSLSEIFYKISGYDGDAVLVEIDELPSGDKRVKASIKPGSITAEMLSPDINTGGGFILTNACISTIHIQDQAITSEKIAGLAIDSQHIKDRAVSGRHLFTSNKPDVILAVREADGDPEWSKIITAMIADEAVTSEKIQNESIGTDHLQSRAVTNDKVADGSISGSKLVINPKFLGTPSISKRPSGDSSTTEVPDTKWVMERLDQYVAKSKNIGERVIRGNHLFTSTKGDEVLVVTSPGYDPIYSKISTKFIEEQGIAGDRLQDATITAKQLKDEAVTPEKLFHSTQPNQVLAVLSDASKPLYTKVTQDLLADGAVGTKQLQDKSISPKKLESSGEDFTVLGLQAGGSEAKWLKILSPMISDRAIVPRTIFTSPDAHRVLGVKQENGDPDWVQVIGEMIANKAIQQDHIGDKAIVNRHLSEGIVESKHLVDHSITGDKLAPRSVTGLELFSSQYPNRVLAVVNNAHEHPQWVQITGEMLGDVSIDISKLKYSDVPFSVLGSTIPGKAPEYLRIDGRFFDKDVNLPGTPTIGQSPSATSNDHSVADTSWVRQYIAGALTGTDLDIRVDIPDHSVDGQKLFTSGTPGVLGIKTPGDNASYIRISKDLMEEHSVGSEQLEDNLQLRGVTTITRRPDASASDVAGNGSLIPDCQWVIDRIEAAVKELNLGNQPSTPDNPDTGDDDYYDDDEWTEMREEPVNETWGTDGEGELESDDPDEIPHDFIKETWENNGVGEIETDDPDELTYDQVKAIWDNPESSSSTQTGDWIEMAAAGVIATWDSDGEGELESDENEIDDATVRSIWDADGAGDTGAESSEITDETVVEIWNNGGAGDVETDPTPGPFPGESGSTSGGGTSGSGSTSGTTGTATALKGDGIVHNNHLGDRIVNGPKLFTSLEPNVVLTVEEPDTDPKWSKITGPMIAKDAVNTDHVQDGAITEEKLSDELRAKLGTAGEGSGGSGSADIPNQSIDDSKIADHSVTGRKLARNTQIPAYTTVEPQTDYEKKSVRNIIISHRSPRGGSNGDIWFQYF
ncbi:MAG: hypothetical protein NC131_11305 [Roseburia sp.]|nr:hypothetical protein [Roseburia sp.]